MDIISVGALTHSAKALDRKTVAGPQIDGRQASPLKLSERCPVKRFAFRRPRYTTLATQPSPHHARNEVNDFKISIGREISRLLSADTQRLTNILSRI